MQALLSAGFEVPEQFRRPANIAGEKYYDQIAFRLRPDGPAYFESEPETHWPSAGAFDIFERVFAAEQFAQYQIDVANTPNGRKNTGDKLEPLHRLAHIPVFGSSAALDAHQNQRQCPIPREPAIRVTGLSVAAFPPSRPGIRRPAGADESARGLDHLGHHAPHRGRGVGGRPARVRTAGPPAPCALRPAACPLGGGRLRGERLSASLPGTSRSCCPPSRVRTLTSRRPGSGACPAGRHHRSRAPARLPHRCRPHRR